MSKIVIANWKMNLMLSDAITLCDNYKKSSQLIVAPPACYLALIHERYPDLALSSQHVSFVESDEGAYTGELSAKLYASCGVQYAIVGHSERRTLFGVTNQKVKLAISNAVTNKITPIICIGERRKSEDIKESIKFLLQEVDLILSGNITHPFMIAYEPIWAIGTGEQPSHDRLLAIFNALRCEVETRYQDLAKNIRLVYGGSVNADNVSDVLSVENIDGVLVGGSSLDANIMNQIISKAESL